MQQKKIPVPAQESALKKGVMPVINPTGNPFPTKIKLPKDIEALQKLQVKVDLQKIGEAPRAFIELLRQAENPENMIVENGNDQGRLRICERFERVQNAHKSMHPLTIQLLNESRGIFNNSTKVNLAPNTMFHGGEAKAKMSSENNINRQPGPVKSKIAAKILQKK